MGVHGLWSILSPAGHTVPLSRSQLSRDAMNTHPHTAQVGWKDTCSRSQWMDLPSFGCKGITIFTHTHKVYIIVSPTSYL